MKEVHIKMWELTKQEAAELPDGSQVIIYNPLTQNLRVEYIGKNCLARSKNAYSGLVYLSHTEARNEVQKQRS